MTPPARMKKPPTPARPPVPEPEPALPALPPAAWALLVAVAAAMTLLLVTYPVYDSDIWQHLLVGKVIWSTHAIPHTQLWTWPTHGASDVLPSWLFRALLYPFWAAGGAAGITAWRWLTTLLTFGLLWAAARASGARGPWALVALVWCVMFYRYRTQARPETLVAVLVSAQLWLFEKRRAQGVQPGRFDPAWFVVLIALLWANSHISYYIGLLLTAAYWLAAVLPTKSPRPPQAPGTLFLVGLASAAVSFVNPFGWQALWQPFEYFLVWRHEPIYQVIGELAPIDWDVYASAFLAFWFAALGLLALWRWRRRGFDPVQAIVLVVFVPQAVQTQRFLGYLAVLVAAFFARDLDDFCGHVRGARFDQPWLRTALVTVLLVALPFPALHNPGMSPGLGFVWSQYPVRACDWLQAHGVRGKCFNNFASGGYLLWRFYPEPGRLPFMDIHQAGTPADRYLTAHAPQAREAWLELDHKYHFDYIVWPHVQYPGQHLLDQLDADSTWALVFTDDAAAVYLRRSGPLAALAQRERYRLIGAGADGMTALGPRTFADTTLRRQVRGELERAVASSPWNASASDLLANIAFSDGRWEDARRCMEVVMRAGKAVPEVHERLGLAYLYCGQGAQALAQYAIAKRLGPGSKTLDFRMGQALAALGRRAEARAAYERALTADASNVEARDSLAALGAK